MPFRMTNGVAGFQKIMDEIAELEGLKDVFIHVDNMTICGKNKKGHGQNHRRQRGVADKYRFTFSEDKIVLAAENYY